MIYWILSCEHGGNKIPPAYSAYFSESEELLQSHRGWDPGALALFEKLKPLANASYFSTTSRLLVELNRSLHHPNLFSSQTKSLSSLEKDQVIQWYYTPYRQTVEQKIEQAIQQGHQVVHLSIHSFTPELNGEVRNADVGLLYDPKRPREKQVSTLWKDTLKKSLPAAKIRFNYPYLGTADGFTTYLRKKIGKPYTGIEFELNQKWAYQEAWYKGIYRSVEALKQELNFK